MSSYQYSDSHVKDKTVSPTVLSLTWESPYLGKTVFILRRGPELYWAVYDLMMVADALVLKRCQALRIHYNDFTVTILAHESYQHTLMSYCKKDETPLLMHWNYVLQMLTHRHIQVFQGWKSRGLWYALINEYHFIHWLQATLFVYDSAVDFGLKIDHRM